ncbi:hypothetical protein JW877_10630 [bacterium]|nr:hypothetical protein [bacterium]
MEKINRIIPILAIALAIFIAIAVSFSILNLMLYAGYSPFGNLTWI